jgi:hypothetical protein
MLEPRTVPPAPLLRGAPRTAPAPALSPRGRRRAPLAALASRLTERDAWLLEMLAEHTVLTTAHITVLWHTGQRSTNRRLLALYRLGLLDSFRPRLQRGAAPEHYLLARTAADLLSARYATTPAALGWSSELVTRTAYSPLLAHNLGVATFFTHLATTTDPGLGRASAWWSEQRCQQLWGDLVRPDAYGRHTRTDGTGVGFFLEYDTGTESHARLARKLEEYAEAASATRIRPLILFTLHSHRREQNLHHTLATHPALGSVNVATTSRDHTAPGQDEHHPAQAVWLPLGRPAARTRLLDLPGLWPGDQQPTGDVEQAAAWTRSAAMPAPDPRCPHTPPSLAPTRPPRA